MANRKKSNIPTNETPEQRFVRVATTKVNAIIRGMKTLSRLTGMRAKSTDAQRAAIEKALTDALADTMSALKGNKVQTGGFKL
jgi:hypothetical protein